MDSPERGALMLVRFIALTLMAWTLVELTLYWVVCQHANKPMMILPCIIKSLPLLAGLVMLIRAKALAGWLSDKLDL